MALGRCVVPLLVVLGLAGCRESRATGVAPTASASASARASAAAPSAAASIGKPGPAPPAARRPRNVLLLTIDSLRADEMPWAGYSREVAPNLAKLAARSVVYERAYSVSSYTAKSVPAFLTSRYPSSLFRSGWFFTAYSESNLFLAEVLHEHGIRTLSAHGHLYFNRGKNLEQGFDVWEIVNGIEFDESTDNFVTSQKMTPLAEKILGKVENTGKQFFAWFHYMDPHDQYIEHVESPTWGRKARDHYDSEIFFTDLWMGKLLEWAEQQPWWKDTVVIVTSDHGEAFGEHRSYKHAFEVWEVLTRVPWLFAGPGIEPRHVQARRSAVDLAPTIAEIMGVPVPEPFVGKSLLAELEGRAEPPSHEPILVDLPEDSHNPPRRAVIQGDYKLLLCGPGRRWLLYDLSKDPGEEHDLSKSDPDTFAKMTKVFEDAWSKVPTVAPYGGMTLSGGGKADGPTRP